MSDPLRDRLLAGALRDHENGLVLDLGGWRLYTKTDLDEGGPTLAGDAVLLIPGGAVLDVNWDVRAGRAACVEFSTQQHLPLQFYLTTGVRTWDELAAAIQPLLSAVAEHYALPDPCNPSAYGPGR